MFDGLERYNGEYCVSIDHIPGCLIGKGKFNVSCCGMGTEKALVMVMVTRVSIPIIRIVCV
jgi:hypothetical protein